jgi:hypothetical protein
LSVGLSIHLPSAEQFKYFRETLFMYRSDKILNWFSDKQILILF